MLYSVVHAVHLSCCCCRVFLLLYSAVVEMIERLRYPIGEAPKQAAEVCPCED